MASTSARVCSSRMRDPTPYLPGKADQQVAHVMSGSRGSKCKRGTGKTTQMSLAAVTTLVTTHVASMLCGGVV